MQRFYPQQLSKIAEIQEILYQNKLIFPLLQNHKLFSNSNRTCKDASMLYFIQHILVHVGDLNRYSNQIDLAKTFYQYAIYTIPYLGQPYNQIAILHEMKNPLSLLTLGQNQLITTYYYIRSIAIKVTFPLAVSNLEKLFQRLKDIPIICYEKQENEFLNMRLHRNLCFAVIDGLHLIFNEGEYADKVIQQLLKRDKHVILACLNGDYRRRKWSKLSVIIPLVKMLDDLMRYKKSSSLLLTITPNG